MFLATMSHELRTPLNAIIGFSELIGGEMLGPVGNDSCREYANDIRESGQHPLDLINDILDLSKFESGSDQLYEDNIEISELTRSARWLVTGRAQDGIIELETELVWWNSGYLFQVVDTGTGIALEDIPKALIHSVIPVVTLLSVPIGARPSRPRVIGPGE